MAARNCGRREYVRRDRGIGIEKLYIMRVKVEMAVNALCIGGVSWRDRASIVLNVGRLVWRGGVIARKRLPAARPAEMKSCL